MAKNFDIPRIERDLAVLETHCVRDVRPVAGLSVADWSPARDAALDHPPGLHASAFRPFTRGEVWGGRYASQLFSCRAEITPDIAGAPLALIGATNLDNRGPWAGCNPQLLVWVDGELLAAMDSQHCTLDMGAHRKGDVLDIVVWAVTGHPMASQTGKATLGLSIGARDEEVTGFYYDVAVPMLVAKNLPESDTRRETSARLLCDALNLLDLRSPGDECFHASVSAARAFMRDEFYGKYCGDTLIPGEPVVHAVGHTHIDVAYRWTMDDARDKTLRSFTTQLKLMEDYPEFVFMSSQPKLYEWYRERAPKNHARIADKVKSGRWEPEGAMWLEADCNVTSGESLVRQILYGTRFFKQKYGVDCRILWLPDVFGYNAALPGILAGFGIPYFMTTKISWNERNCLPYDTFIWRGVDGSEVLTHFITTQEPEPRVFPHITTYNGMLEPGSMMRTWERYQQKALSGDVLTSFGFGDGGGGVTPEMLEAARRLAKGVPGCPRVELSTAGAFFDKLALNVNGKKLPRWVGELYFELHRGTYTTNGYVKRMNRLCENRIFALEQLLTYRMAGGAEYPREKMDELWEKVLTRQFHDILPGTSVKETYEECRQVYPALLSEVEGMTARALRGIVGDGVNIAVFNPASFERTAEISMDKELLEGMVPCDEQGKPFPSQDDARADGRVLIGGLRLDAGEIRSYSLAPRTVSEKSRLSVSPRRIESEYGVAEFDERMRLTYTDKKTGRSVVGANTLKVFEDLPYRWDAWDISEYYIEKCWEVDDVLSAELVETGPIRATVRVVRRFMSSVITQDISVYRDRPGVEFYTLADWKQTHLLLKAEFPLDIHHEKASYEIQFGVVERPTHQNTPWERAKFEVCAQRFMDVSEDGYGVSLLNDCKYGHDALDGNMRLTLIKSPDTPNEASDREMHEFTYALYPHEGSWREGGTARAARALNLPVVAVAGAGEVKTLTQVASVSGAPSVFIEAVKAAEDNSGDVIVRLHEGHGRRCRPSVSVAGEWRSVCACDLAERKLSELPLRGGRVEVELTPFSVSTLRFVARATGDFAGL